MDLISVIVPVYNVEKYLRRCIDSIINQTYTNLEIILVDDGSPDNCGKICDEYADKDSRIKVIHQQNGGLSAARNAGLDIATGDYIGFVDSDDYIAPEMYEKLYEALVQSDADVSICNFQRVDEEGNRLKTREKINNDIFTNYQALTELQGNKGLCFIIVCNKLFNKALFNEVRFPLGKKCEDNYIAHKLIYNSKRAVCIDDILYYYLQRETSIMSNITLEFCFDEIKGFMQRRQFFVDNNLLEYVPGSERCIIGSYRRNYCSLSDYDIQFLKNEFEKTIYYYFSLKNGRASLIDYLFINYKSIFRFIYRIIKKL